MVGDRVVIGGALFSRALRVFFHTRSAVILTVVSPAILWVIFIAFFRPHISGFLEGLGSIEVAAITDSWLFASVAVLSLFPSTLGVFIGFVTDFRSGRFGLLLASGAKRWQLVWSYLLAAVLVSFVIGSIMLLTGQVWAMAFGQPIMSIDLLLRSLIGLLLGAVFFAAFNAAAVTFTLSQGSFGAYGFMMGTVVGILSLSYTLNHGGGLFQLIGALPFAQVATLVHAPAVAPSVATAPANLQEPLNDLLQAHIHLNGGTVWPTWTTVVILLLWTFIALLICQFRVSRLMRHR